MEDNINFSDLSLEDLILELDKLSNNSNPLSVSKKEEIKLFFYKKLKSKSLSRRIRFDLEKMRFIL